MEISSSCRIGKHFHNRKMVCEGSRSISTAKKRSARGRGAFLQRKNGLRGVAEHFHSEKMAGEGSRSISTTKKWPAGGRGAFLQQNFVFARLIVPFVCASSI